MKSKAELAQIQLLQRKLEKRDKMENGKMDSEEKNCDLFSPRIKERWR